MWKWECVPDGWGGYSPRFTIKGPGPFVDFAPMVKRNAGSTGRLEWGPRPRIVIDPDLNPFCDLLHGRKPRSGEPCDRADI